MNLKNFKDLLQQKLGKKRIAEIEQQVELESRVLEALQHTGSSVTLKDFQELLEQELTKQEIAEIEHLAEVEVGALRAQAQQKMPR